MLKVVAVSVIALAPGAAVAAPWCEGPSKELLSVTSWSVAPEAGNDTARVTVALLNNGGAFRQVDGIVVFEDALGRYLFDMALTPDLAAAAGAEIADANSYPGVGKTRIASIDPKQVNAYVCVRSIVLPDGSKESFK